MSRADWIYLKTTNRILKEGCWDTNEIVRPKWSDGTPAHTAKVFAVNNVYDLSKELPIVTLRFTNWKSAIDEVLWIWQQKSNDVKKLNSNIWNQWADENGTIGKAYGWQVAQKSQYDEGEFDQIDRVIWNLKNKPAFRGMLTELFVHKDLHEMGLYPCVHGMQFDVANGKLNLFLNQRSNDTLAAGSWNVVQYAALVYMLAQTCGLEPGTLSHMIVNSHIYDRHIPYIVDITLSRAQLIEQLTSSADLSHAKTLLSEAKFNMFKKFANELSQNKVDYSNEIECAQDLERKVGQLEDKDDKMNSQENADLIDFEEYTKRVAKTEAFKKADMIVETMFNNPEFEEVFNIKSSKLLLDENVKDFYDFKSPKMRNEEGKIVDNPESSFKIENYDYQQLGVALQTKVPVAE